MTEEQPPAGPAAVPIDVLIAHPDEPGRALMRAALETGGQVRVVALAAASGEALTVARQLRPAVTLFDDRLAIPSGADIVAALAGWSRVIVLTGTTDPPTIVAMLRGPVHGCLVYDHFEPVDIARAVYAVAGGLGWLSPVAASAAAAALTRPFGPVPGLRADLAERLRLTGRERDVLELVCRGMSNAAIATALSLAEKTVRNHLSRGMTKLGVRTRSEAMLRLTADEPDPPD
jgi:DNA-binding NarL/FixJ family response regulator